MAKVTIDAIAKKAGVSKTSVSFAFNNPGRLSEATLNRILEVAEELGYSPDPLASNLKTGRTACLGLLVPQPIPVVVRNPHICELIEGVGEVVHDFGMSLMLVPPVKGNLRRAIVRAAVDGFLTIGLEPFRKTMKVLHQRGVPFVMIDSDPTPGIPCVNVDDEMGAYMAMQYILRHGHRRIGILGILSEYGGRFKEYPGLLKRRVDGYLRALDEVGLTIDNETIRLVECNVVPEDGYRAFRRLWRTQHPPTAIVAMGDILALGALQAARELNVNIPGDVSIIGYDDTVFSPLVEPPLTTIRQPTADKGREAARLLLDLIEGNEIESEHIVLPVELIERQSCQMAPDELSK